MKKEQTESKSYPPPDDLSERSKQIWVSIIPDRGRSPGRLLMIAEALRALDQADECADIIFKEGLTSKTKTTGAIHIHPLAKIEKEKRALFFKAWKTLHLFWSSEDSIMKRYRNS